MIKQTHLDIINFFNANSFGCYGPYLLFEHFWISNQLNNNKVTYTTKMYNNFISFIN